MAIGVLRNTFSFLNDYIFVTGLQEFWNGYTYYWHCTIYDKGLETEIVGKDVRGYTGEHWSNIISATGRDFGTYYIQMTGTCAASPLATPFMSGSY